MQNGESAANQLTNFGFSPIRDARHHLLRQLRFSREFHYCKSKCIMRIIMQQQLSWRSTIKGRLNGGPFPLMVGARGFEPPTPATPLQCATRLRHAPTLEPIVRQPASLARPKVAFHSVSGRAVSPKAKKCSSRHHAPRYQTAPRPGVFELGEQVCRRVRILHQPACAGERLAPALA